MSYQLVLTAAEVEAVRVAKGSEELRSVMGKFGDAMGMELQFQPTATAEVLMARIVHTNITLNSFLRLFV